MRLWIDSQSRLTGKVSVTDPCRPAKSLPMQGVMLYFSGSGVQIFSLAMIFSLLTGPIGAVFGILKSESARRCPGRLQCSLPLSGRGRWGQSDFGPADQGRTGELNVEGMPLAAVYPGPAEGRCGQAEFRQSCGPF
jgi:hypothetical protein